MFKKTITIIKRILMGMGVLLLLVLITGPFIDSAKNEPVQNANDQGPAKTATNNQVEPQNITPNDPIENNGLKEKSDAELYRALFALALISTGIFLVLFFLKIKSINKLIKEIDDKEESFSLYRTRMDPLRKYEGILDAEAEADRLLKEADSIRNQAQVEYDAKIKQAQEIANLELTNSRAKAKEMREKAEQKLKDAHELANKIETDAREKAEEIAGDAWEAKENADQYKSTVKAMKNIIKGYGDEYLIPNKSVLDDLAEEYDHKEAGQELAKIRTLIKSMIKNSETAECDYVEPYRRTTAIEFVLDAFNGKVDTIMSKVRHDNYGKLLQQLEDAYRLVNHNGKAFRNARIIPRYYEAVVEQLNWAVATQELKRLDMEEQRRIKEEMREEERARREYEKARKEAEKEEKMLQQAMAEAEKRLAAAAEDERATFEEQIAKLKDQLTEAEERGQRAMSMAQQTKQGHVYVISNIGSFGEDVFKIGLTRRLEPLIRVKELGDASVPFEFDVHAMIHADDAPSLENELHQFFDLYHLNKVNPRKEFFKIPISAIKNKVAELGFETHWTMKAEAREYHESLQIEKKHGLKSGDHKVA